jgi:predicted phage terminase large subunit-like protein
VPRFPTRSYIPHVPHPPQQAFLLLNFIPEAFFGGAAGGGKSDAGLMAQLQFADVPGYSALIIRRTFPDLSLPGAIMDRANEWLANTGAHKLDGGKRWEFPTNDPAKPATLQFGYAATHKDVYRYQGAEFQSVFVDELTHFEERTYRYLFSRLRGPALVCANCGHGTSQLAGEDRRHDEDHDWCECGHEHAPFEVCEGDDVEGCGCADYRPTDCDCTAPDGDRSKLVAADDGTTLADVPLRMRSGSNPGGVGHEWVKARFINPETRERKAVFVPSKLGDNPSLDRRAYRASLSHLTLTEIARLERGDWDAMDEGELFKRIWFQIRDEAPGDCRWVRFWDKAATKPIPSKRADPDWTVGVKVGLDPRGQWWIADVRRMRGTPLEIRKLVEQTAALDGRRVPVRMEEEGGSSGIGETDTYRREVLVGYDFDGARPSIPKTERAAPVARAAQAGNVFLITGGWNSVYIDEHTAFPTKGVHDDQVDATSGGFDFLAHGRRARIIA